MATTNPLDQLLLSLGKPGRFQVFLFILLCTNAYPITFNFLYITFFTNVPAHWCKLEEGPDADNSSFYPLDKDDKGKSIRSQCKMYEDPFDPNSTLQNCNNGPKFNLVQMEETIAVEWDLVCDEKYLASLASTIFFAGVMIGGLVCGTIADKFGRRPVVLGTLYGQALLGLGAAFSPNYTTFVVLKFFQGMLLQGLQSSNNSLVMEMFPLCYRTIAGMILVMCATSAHMFFAPLLYYLPYWNQLQVLISSLTGVSLIYSWLYPESLRWQLAQHQQESATKTVRRFAQVNKVSLPDNIGDQLHEISKEITTKAESTKQYDIRDLFRTPVMRRYTLSLLFSWFAVSLTYYGIQFYIPKMGGGYYRYLNLFASGAMETAARVVGYFIIDRLGRRKPLIFFYIMSGLLCILSGLLGTFTEEPVVANVFAILGKVCSAQCFAFILIYSSEIFPTVFRTVGLGAVACLARIGTMLAPQILLLKEETSLYVPFIIFGSVSFVSAAAIYFMPETKGLPLPNTVADIEDILAVPAATNGIDNPALQSSPPTKQKQVNSSEGRYRIKEESVA